MELNLDVSCTRSGQQLKQLVEALAKVNIKLTDLKSNVASLRSTWSKDEVDFQQEQMVKLQLMKDSLNSAAISRPEKNNTSNDSRGVDVCNSASPTRSAFAEVHLNGQLTHTGSEQSGMKIDPQTLHRQLRAMINTTAHNIRSTPRVCNTPNDDSSEIPLTHRSFGADLKPPMYESSGLFLMIDPETGQPVGGQVVRHDQIDGRVFTTLSHASSASARQDDSISQERPTELPHNRFSTGNDAGDNSISSARPSTNRSEPAELQTPEIRNSRDGQVFYRSQVLQQGQNGQEFKMNHDARDDEASLSLRAPSTSDGKGLSMDADDHALINSKAEFISEPDAHAQTADKIHASGEQNRALEQSKHGYRASISTSFACHRPELNCSTQPSIPSQESSQIIEVNNTSGEDSQVTIPLQPSSTSLSSQEIVEPLVGPIGTRCMPMKPCVEESASGTAEFLAEGGDSPLGSFRPGQGVLQDAGGKHTHGTSSDPFGVSTAADNHNKFSDFSARNSVPEKSKDRLSNSTAVLGLLREDSDLKGNEDDDDDDDMPMSFIKPKPLFHKGCKQDESTKSPDLSGFNMSGNKDLKRFPAPPLADSIQPSPIQGAIPAVVQKLSVNTTPSGLEMLNQVSSSPEDIDLDF